MARWNKTLLARLPEPLESFEGWCGFCDGGGSGDPELATIVVAAKWSNPPEEHKDWGPMSAEYLCAHKDCGGVYENIYDGLPLGPNYFPTREAARKFLNPDE